MFLIRVVLYLMCYQILWAMHACCAEIHVKCTVSIVYYVKLWRHCNRITMLGIASSRWTMKIDKSKFIAALLPWPTVLPISSILQAVVYLMRPLPSLWVNAGVKAISIKMSCLDFYTNTWCLHTLPFLAISLKIGC